MPVPSLKEIIQTINDSHKTLYILCGLPYSGKTYLSKEILAKTSCVYVSIDQILQEFGFDWSSNKLPNENGWREVFDLSYRKVQEALGDGHNVLYDSTNHTKASRDTLRKIAQAVSAGTKVIYVNVSTETVWERWRENSIENARPAIDKKLIDTTIESFEAPTEDENLLTAQND